MKLMNGVDLIAEGDFVWSEREKGWQSENTVYVDVERKFSLVDDAPNSISMRQARLKLLELGLLDSVNSAITSMPQAAAIEWEYATVIQRNNPLVVQLQISLAMTDSDMDNFFRQAVTL